MHMIRTASVIALAVFASLLTVQTTSVAKGFDKGPPPGIVPTTATLAQVLMAHKKAVGKAIDPNASFIEDGTLATNGLTGTYHDVDAGGGYIQTTTLGPFTSSFGASNGQSWSEDENGQVVRHEGVHQRGSVDARALEAALTKPEDDVKLLGEVLGPPVAYVVEVNPPNGRREWIFFDKTTYQTVRTESIMPTSRVVATYSDFKPRNGFTEPWSGHWSDGDAVNDEDWHVKSQQSNAIIDPTQLQIPQSRPFLEFPQGQTSVDLPIKVIDGDIVVQLMVGGRGYDFLLDSGSSEFNVDYAAAQQMGLTLYGKSLQTAAGKFSSSESMIPEVDVGPLKMHNVVVTVLPFSRQEATAMQLVGLIGYDFLAGATMRIDYDNRKLVAMVPGQYVPPPDATALPVLLDDRVPVAAAQIGSSFGDHFIIDTGANKGFVFPGFVASHPDDMRDQGEGGQISAYDPFIYATGVGGEVQLKPTQVKVLSLGGVRFERWLVYAMPGDVAQEDEDYDGLIGYDFLKYFNVVFDYRNSVIFLEPNATFKRNVTRG